MAEANTDTLDTEKGHTNTGLQQVQCGPCEARFIQTKATHWCTSCEEGLCTNCCEYHKASKSSRNHSTITVHKFQTLKPFITSLNAQCEVHESPVALYCPNHEAPCCTSCAFEFHSTCLGITSFPEFVSKLRKSSYIENVDTTTDNFLHNIDSIIENRKANKDRLCKEANDRKTKLAKIRKEINDYLDLLDSRMIEKSDAFLSEEEVRTDSILKCLDEKKKSILQIKNNFSEFRQDGTDTQIFYGGKKLLESVKQEEDSLFWLFEGPDIIETSLEFHIDPMLKGNILKTVDVNLKREKSVISLAVLQKSSCQIAPSFVSNNISKMKAVLMTPYDTSTLTGTTVGCIAALPDGHIIVSDYDGCMLLVFTSDGHLDNTFEMQYQPFGLAYLGNQRLAVSFPESCKLHVLTIEDYQCEYEIILDGPCWGLSFSEDSLAVSFRRTNILLIDIFGNIQRNFPMVKQDLVYVHNKGNNLYRADFVNNLVHCYEQPLGKRLWQFNVKSDEALGTRGICTDSHGNLFVACQSSNCVVLISKDGKNHKVLLPFNKPKAVCYDEETSILYVCSCNGENLSSYQLSSF